MNTRILQQDNDKIIYIEIDTDGIESEQQTLRKEKLREFHSTPEGFCWSFESDPPDFYWSTNSDGMGLWKHPYGVTPIQVAGTGQYSVTSEMGMKQRLTRNFNSERKIITDCAI